MSLSDMTQTERATLLEQLREEYADLKRQGLNLDLTRGKPSSDQLDLSNALLELPKSTHNQSGTDVRNYGGGAGLVELRSIFGELLGVDIENVIAAGNSSLTLMYDVLIYHWLFGGPDSPAPWGQERRIRFITPVPGYDRHFALLESLGIEMVNVPMTDDGPDVDACAQLVQSDPTIKGMWVVPTYANPSGAIVTEEAARRLASMPTAAPDFRIMWDNAYAVHHLTESETPGANILQLTAEAGHAERAFMFASTSKITFAGAGVAFLASSKRNIEWFLGHSSVGSIGPDKVNQLRHAEFFGDAQGVRQLMRRHREIIAPKFAAVDEALHSRLDGYGVAAWNKPTGGYFVNLDVLPGTAARVVSLAKEAGISLTPAGSSFPRGEDPKDENIRLAPTLPPLEDVKQAMSAVALCVLIAALEAQV